MEQRCFLIATIRKSDTSQIRRELIQLVSKQFSRLPFNEDEKEQTGEQLILSFVHVDKDRMNLNN